MSKDIKTSKTAIVIGASMAGLLAARALADHFEQVTLLERDVFPPPGENRRGVPQGKHTHVLLERGRRIMEQYFPGLTDELAQQGAVIVEDASLSVRWFRSGGHHQPGVSGIAGVAVSRPTLEALVRDRVLALRNVNAVQGCKVVGLVTAGGNRSAASRVTGVRVAGGETGVEETRLADLVVDASGRGSRTPSWLEEMGYERPEVEEVEVRVGYTTCYYRRRPEHLQGLHGLVFMSTPPDRRIGIMMAQERDRWVVTLGGYLGDHVPPDHRAFLDAARRLPAPDMYHVIKDAERLSGPVPYSFRANVRHHYEKLDRFPEGYVVTGDALCSFNPIYAQGMTVAAMEAEALGDSLANGKDRLAERFFARTTELVDVSWNSAVGTDLGYGEVEGPRTALVRFLNWYVSKVHIAAHEDAEVSIAFLKVTNMLAPPPSILHPRIVWRVIIGNVRPGRRTPEPHGGAAILEGPMARVEDEQVEPDLAGNRIEPQRQMLKER